MKKVFTSMSYAFSGFKWIASASQIYGIGLPNLLNSSNWLDGGDNGCHSILWFIWIQIWSSSRSFLVLVSRFWPSLNSLSCLEQLRPSSWICLKSRTVFHFKWFQLLQYIRHEFLKMYVFLRIDRVPWLVQLRVRRPSNYLSFI